MHKRSYRQFCGLARALDVVGERWTLLIVRNLLLAPRRYGNLLAQLPGITTNLLAKRLREMAEARLVRKTQLPPPAGSIVYELTEEGAALEPAMSELARWGGRLMDRPKRGDTVNLAWGMLSLKRRYRGGESFVAEIRAGGRAFELTFAPAKLRVLEREAPVADVRVAGEEDAVRALFWGEISGHALRREGALVVSGREASWHRLLGALLPAPSPGIAAATSR